MDKANLWAMAWHRTTRLLFSLRGLLALMFTVYMMGAIVFFLDEFMASGTVIGELVALFNARPDLQFQWAFFDSGMSKLVTLFVAPLFIFDSISGDKSGERTGLILARPISRVQYLMINLVSAILAFGIVYFGVLSPGYWAISPSVPELEMGAYFSTMVLMFLLGIVAMSGVMLISAFAKSNLVSFIASFGVMSVFMLPNAMKYSSQAYMDVARATPHYYATYFTTNDITGGDYVLHAVIVLLFAVPFLALTIMKFGKEDL